MGIKVWDELPEYMKNDSVRFYYDIIKKRIWSLAAKRLFDMVMSVIVLFVLSPVFLILSVWIKLDSNGPIMFRQVRVTEYGKQFRIFKFRTMIANAEVIGSQVTTENDMRITNAGRFLRKCRLDEIPQVLNIFRGEISFVGTRPEVPKYVERYTDEMYATLLLPAGVTSEASIQFKDEDKLLADVYTTLLLPVGVTSETSIQFKDEEKLFAGVANVDDTYVNVVLPQKMRYNLEAIKQFSFWGDIKTMARTVIAVLR